MEGDEAYFRRRAVDEAKAAELAKSKPARAVHLVLAARYAEFADAINEHRVILNTNWGVRTTSLQDISRMPESGQATLP